MSAGSENLESQNLESQNLVPLNRTLDQELLALVRGASLECLVCGEFVLHVRGTHGTSCLACPECHSILVQGREIPAVDLPAGGLPSAVQAG